MLAVFRLLRVVFETFHALTLALGTAALVLLAVDVIPDLLNAGRQALRSPPRNSADIRSPDFRTGSEAYRGEDWAPFYFYELQQSHYSVEW
jgi:hypothetical protein